LFVNRFARHYRWWLAAAAFLLLVESGLSQYLLFFESSEVGAGMPAWSKVFAVKGLNHDGVHAVSCCGIAGAAGITMINDAKKQDAALACFQPCSNHLHWC
jgi:hypothetical protein